MIYNIVESCKGCSHTDGHTCERYLRPRAKWTKLGGCECATHMTRTEKPPVSGKVRAGQQKQTKQKQKKHK